MATLPLGMCVELEVILEVVADTGERRHTGGYCAIFGN
jgi:hypothetical protein